MSTTDAIALPLPLPARIDLLRQRLRRRRRRVPPPEGPNAMRFVWWWLLEIAYQWWATDTWLSAQHWYAAVLSVALSCLGEVAWRKWMQR